MRTKLTKVFKADTDKQGKPWLDRKGAKKFRVAIKTSEHGDQWLSGFFYPTSPVLGWKEGDEVDIEVTTQGDYLNFALPKAKSAFETDIENEIKMLWTIVRDLQVKVEGIEEVKAVKVAKAMGDLKNDLEAKDLPF